MHWFSFHFIWFWFCFVLFILNGFLFSDRFQCCCSFFSFLFVSVNWQKFQTHWNNHHTFAPFFIGHQNHKTSSRIFISKDWIESREKKKTETKKIPRFDIDDDYADDDDDGDDDRRGKHTTQNFFKFTFLFTRLRERERVNEFECVSLLAAAAAVLLSLWTSHTF